MYVVRGLNDTYMACTLPKTDMSTDLWQLFQLVLRFEATPRVQGGLPQVSGDAIHFFSF
jgi:hypothetical protein